jgi:sulfite reductase beta subunit-like hemoprotein
MGRFDDPLYWRKRAEEARRIAERTEDPAARQRILVQAAGYDALAERAEARAVKSAGWGGPLQALLRPFPAELMAAHDRPRIGNVRNDDAALIERVSA